MSRIINGLFASIFFVMVAFVLYESFKDKKPSVTPSKFVQPSDSSVAIVSVDTISTKTNIEYVDESKMVDIKDLYPALKTTYTPKIRSYSYYISGYGDSGYVWGYVDVSKDGGDGVIYDEDGNEVHISVEWTGNGTLEGYGDDGSFYELEVD